ncbi:minor tail protein [Arthrobacter phage Gisselle]|uniref:Minor tail protein n=1 Tax=Arthrobacter phage Gisselle TaxID=2743905 RepID=A0AAE7K5S7_9CAUD|nr:minor tail protein [Arthrobacter phage Gisselle]QDH48920.1 minor tail protein [Arthrobacter phage DreamTeam]QKY79321.1 minor tail protein [Arthrobacter phage Gisselle]
MTDNLLVAPTSATLELTTGENIQWGAPGSGSQLLMSKIKGWHGSSPIRRDKSDRLGAHGTHSERGWKDERLIQIDGAYIGTSPLDAEMKVQELAGLFGDGTEGKFTTNSALGTRWANIYLTGDGFDPVWTGRAQFKFTIFLLAPDPRKYGSSLWSPEIGIPTESGGLRFDLFSGQWDLSRTNYASNGLPFAPATTELYSTNRAVNPDFETGYSSWTLTGCTAAITSSFSQMLKSGTNILQCTSDGTSTIPGISVISASYRPAVTPGQWASFGAFTATETGYETRVWLNWRDAAGATISNTTGVWTVASFYAGANPTIVGQAPALAASVGYYIQYRNPADPTNPVPAGKRMWVDAVSVFVGDTQGEVTTWVNEPFYCGATTNDDFTYTWTGTAHLSATTKFAPVTPTGWNYLAGTGEIGDTLWRSLTGPDGRSGLARRAIYVPKASGSTGWSYTESGLTGNTNDTYTGQMVLNCPNTLGSRLRITFLMNSTTVNQVDSAIQTLTAGVPTTVNVAGTATGAFNRITLWFYHTTGNTPDVGNYDASRALIEQTEAVDTPWFDGDSSDTTGHDYGWNGVQGASSSYDLIPHVPSTVGILDFGVSGSTGTVSLSNPGTADTGPKFTITGTTVPGFTITELNTGRRLVYTGTIRTGQKLVIDTDDGSVLLDGYAPRELAVAEWTRLGRGETGSWLFESPGSNNAKMKVEVRPAWW